MTKIHEIQYRNHVILHFNESCLSFVVDGNRSKIGNSAKPVQFIGISVTYVDFPTSRAVNKLLQCKLKLVFFDGMMEWNNFLQREQIVFLHSISFFASIHINSRHSKDNHALWLASFRENKMSLVANHKTVFSSIITSRFLLSTFILISCVNKTVL
jgi:hypothetical protein